MGSVLTEGYKQIKLNQFWSYEIASVADENMAKKRFTELFATNTSAGRGGAGKVIQVKNALGETFALKMPRMDVPEEYSAQEAEKARETRIAAFTQEYKNQATFCRAKNFPKVFGLGEVEGTPVMVMEWIDGGTIRKAAELKVKDPKRAKVPPRIVAKIGIQLLQMVENLQYADESFIHRDISANNIMFRTSKKSIEQQLETEDFDMCLIDFGSSCSFQGGENSLESSQAENFSGATPEYAAPEMLTAKLPNVRELRHSVKIDSYAICSLLYELLAGRTPYDLKHCSVSPDTLYSHKMNNKIPVPKTLHANSGLKEICTLDSKISSVFKKCWSKVSQQSPTNTQEIDLNNRFLNALNKADTQLGLILLQGLNPQQSLRANPTQLKNMLQEFLKNYDVNVINAFEGKPLLPFVKAKDAAKQPAQQPVILMQATENPKFVLVSDTFYANPRARLLFEKEKKKIAFSKGIFAFGMCLCAAFSAIFAFALNNTLCFTSATAADATNISGALFICLLMLPEVIAGAAFLMTPKKGADLLVGTTLSILFTVLIQTLTSGWRFVSEFARPLLTLAQICLVLIFTITICSSRKHV